VTQDVRVPSLPHERRFTNVDLVSALDALVNANVDAHAVDLSSPEFWLASRPDREGVFKALRDAPELRFSKEFVFEDSPFPAGPGYYSLVRHEDVWFASRNPHLFISGKGSNIQDLPMEMAEFFGSMIAMDDPRHFRLRSIVSKGFTPREVARIEEYVTTKARSLVDAMIEQHPDRTCDFVEAFAAPLPLQIICEMMGIPPSDEAQIFGWTNTILGAGDPEFGGSLEALMGAAMGMFSYAQALGEDRLKNPSHDLTSIMMHAEVDGERLTPQEFGSFFILLVVAGNETTRNAISHGLRTITQYPAQRDIWFGDFETHTKTAVDEIVRWATPVIHFRRTATEDVVLHNTKISAGDKVVLWYNSANRDDRVFDNPYEFDVRRPLQPAQVGFGAGGPHFCLGANLARREIGVAFDELRRRLPNIEATSDPAFLESNFINGIKRLQCAW
jgi:methyl-branched lipid omega-hydroxylase